MITRRLFFTAAASLLAAPAVVRAASLMAVRPVPAPEAGQPPYRWVEIEAYKSGVDIHDPFGIAAVYDGRWPVHVGDIDRRGVAHWRVTDVGVTHHV